MEVVHVGTQPKGVAVWLIDPNLQTPMQWSTGLGSARISLTSVGDPTCATPLGRGYQLSLRCEMYTRRTDSLRQTTLREAPNARRDSDHHDD